MLSVKAKKRGSYISFILSTLIEFGIMAMFLIAAVYKSSITMYEALLWAIVMFVVVYWSNSAYNGMCIDENGNSVLSKGTRKVFNVISLLSSIALFAVGAVVFIDYYFYSIF